jgi:UDP-N-acetylbacillosamine N-acetyltransferase
MVVARDRRMKSQKLVIYGGGGHGRVVADAAAAAGFEVLGFLDDALSVGHQVSIWRVLGDSRWLGGKQDVGIAHGIGDNAARERATHSLASMGLVFVTVIHPSAVISPTARAAAGAVVLATAVLNADAQVGSGAIINTAAVVEHDAVVGDFAHVAPNATLGGGARIDRLAFLGSGAIVLPGRSVGPESLVGAGAVVTRDVKSRTVVAGVPARLMKEPET